MITGIIKRISIETAIEQRVYEGRRDRQRWIDRWSGIATTTAIQIVPYANNARLFKKEFRENLPIPT